MLWMSTGHNTSRGHLVQWMHAHTMWNDEAAQALTNKVCLNHIAAHIAMQGSSATATCLNTSSTYLMISRMQLIKTELEPVLLNDDTTCTISHIYVRDICTPQTDHRKYFFFFIQMSLSFAYTLVTLWSLAQWWWLCLLRSVVNQTCFHNGIVLCRLI